MKLNLPEPQRRVLARMKPDTWYSVMDLKVSLETLDALFEKGLLYRRVIGLPSLYTNILFCKKVR